MTHRAAVRRAVIRQGGKAGAATVMATGVGRGRRVRQGPGFVRLLMRGGERLLRSADGGAQLAELGRLRAHFCL